MNRLDLSWALNAVIPHAGTAAQHLDHVGLTYRNGSLFVHATDRYTAAVARIDGPNVGSIALPTREATDLMRFARPQRVPEREQQLYSTVEDGELHVGYETPGLGLESQVYETCTQVASLEFLLIWFRTLLERQASDDDLIVNPKLLEKFAKAQRVDTDRLWILPRNVDERHGAAVVTVGQDFIGAVAGLSYDELGDATVASFLYEKEAA